MAFKIAQPLERHFRLFDTFDKPTQVASVVNDREQAPLVNFEKALEPLKRHVAHLNDMLTLVKPKCRQPHDHLSLDESASIMLYTMKWTPEENAFHNILNRALSSDDANNIQPWHLYVKLICTSLSKLPTSSSRILYRDTHLNSADDYPTGQTFFWRGFVSCSSSIRSLAQKEYPFNQADTRAIIIIYTNQGKTITQHAFSETHHETLLACNQQFHVVSNQVSKDKLRVIVVKDLSSYDPIEVIPLPAHLVSTPVEAPREVQRFTLLLSKRLTKYLKHSEINLQMQNLTDAHLQIVVREAIQKKQCSWLSLQKNQITERGLAILAEGLANNASLESLYLSCNSIAGSGVECLTTALSHNYSCLTILALDHNRIDDQGAQYIARLLKTNGSLADLWLSYNQISDRGLQALTDVLISVNSTLMQLYLDGNRSITGSDIESLRLMLVYNQTLNTLWLQDCNLSPKTKEQLCDTVTTRDDFDLNV